MVDRIKNKRRLAALDFWLVLPLHYLFVHIGVLRLLGSPPICERHTARVHVTCLTVSQKFPFDCEWRKWEAWLS